MEGFIAFVLTVTIPLVIVAICVHRHPTSEKRIAQGIPLSPTFMWLNTACLLTTVRTVKFPDEKYLYNHIIGLADPGANSQSIREMLEASWGIVDAQTAEREMENLLKNGMRSQYDREMQMFDEKYDGLSEEELIAQLPGSNEDSYLPKMLTAYRREGADALLGWDVGRLCFHAQACYLVGYLSKEKMLSLCVRGGKMAQRTYRNWEEMMESYLLGVQYWKNEDAQNAKSETFKRTKLYKEIYEGSAKFRFSPFMSVPFKTELTEEELTDDRGYLVNPS